MKTQPSSVATFVEVFIRHVDALVNPKLPPEYQLLATLEKCKQASAARFERFCKEVLQEILATTEDWPVARVQEADALLGNAGALTLTAMRNKSVRKLATLLQRGTLKTRTEYEAVRSFLDDQATGGSDAFRAGLDRLLLDFESRQG